MQHTNTATAFWITSARSGEFRTSMLPAREPGQVVVRTLYTGISKGTESLVYNASIPVSEYERMRAPFQEGNFPYPVKYGYINVGCVEQGPQSLIGQNVFCLYPHQDKFVVPEDAVTPIPIHIPVQRAVLSANLETAINALWDAQPSIGDRISVVGAGVVGCLVAWLAAQIPGCEVELIDVVEQRAVVAHHLGVGFSVPENAQQQRDLIIHTSASEQGLNLAIEIAAFEATIVELSWFGDKSVSLALGGAFHSQRLQIRASQVGTIGSAQGRRWDYSRRMALAMTLLDNEVLDHLITGQSTFKELSTAFEALIHNGQDTLCHRISYP